MKKFFVTLALIIGFSSAALPALAAVDIGIDPNNNGMVSDVAKQGGFTTAGVTDTSLAQTIGRIVKSVLGLLGTIFFVLMVYAGVLWTTAAGNDEQVTKATGIIRSATIGLIIVMMAYSITILVIAQVMLSTTGGGTDAASGGFWQFFKTNWQRFVF